MTTRYAQSERQCFAQHKACLRHRPFDAVDQQQCAVDHVQHALDLTAEVGVTGRIDDVDFGVVVGDGGVLAQDGDTALFFEGVAI
jgi:hypothetical protein